jgi:phosphoribosyl 1,2-cyclic phosphate phosphodiesterase
MFSCEDVDQAASRPARRAGKDANRVMKIRFLGTSAAGGFPNPHCRCENCVAARAEGGRSLRQQSSALINDDLLIDLGPDVSSAVLMQGIDLSHVAYVLQTHPHDDHLLTLHVAARAADWAAKNAVPLRWYGSEQTLMRLEAAARKYSVTRAEPGTPMEPAHGKLALTPIRQGQEYTFGDYRVQTVTANHDPSVDPMLFAIEWRGRRLFYGTDTSSLADDTWPRLADLGWTFDLVVFDHNDGFLRPTSATHMGSAGMLREVERMRALGLISSTTQVLGTHLGHHSNGPHSIEAARAAELGYQIAWDGLVIEV